MTDDHIMREVRETGIGWEDVWVTYHVHGISKQRARWLTWQAHKQNAQSAARRLAAGDPVSKTASTTK